MKALLKPTRLVTFIAMILIVLTTKAQEFTAGINTETPNPNAVLHLVSPNGNQGLLVPTLTNAQRNAMSLTATDNGLMVFDTDDNGFYFWANPSWILMSNTDQQDLANVLSQANDAGANQIKNVADPTDPQDVATKFYVDNLPSQDPVSTDAGNIIVSGGDGGAFLGNVDFANVINLPTSLDLDNTDDITLTTIPAVGDISGDYSNGFQINPGVVTTLEITDGTIANADLDANAVQSGNILDGTITDADIGDVTAGKVTGLGTAATLNVGTTDGDVVQVQSGGFLPALNGANLTGVTATIAANSITNTEIGPDAVQTGNILDGTIVDADINDVAVGKITGAPNLDLDATDDLVSGSNISLLTNDAGFIVTESDPVWTGDRTTLGSAAGTINTPSNLVDWSQLKSVPADFADGTDDVGIISEADPVWIGDRTTLGSAAGTINTPSNIVDWSQLKSVPADFADGTDDVGIISEADPVWIGDRTTLGSAAGTINTPSNIVDWSQLKSVPAGFADGVDDGIVSETQTLANVIALGNDAGGSIISNVLDPAAAQDVATRNYVDSQGFITGESQTLANVIALGNDAGGSIISNVLDPAAAQDVATRNYVDSQGFITGESQTLANVIALGNDAGGSIISNVLDPAAAQDVATRNYVDSQGFITGESQTLANVIALGNDAGGSIISNVLDPAAAQDVATRNYVDSQGFITGESQTLANVIALGNDAGGSIITNVLDPAAAQDVATKNYVDTGISSVTLTTGNGITVASPNINLGGTLTAAATITTGAGSNDLIIDGAGEFVTNTAIATSLNSATINLGNEAADNINVRGGITFVEATQNLALDVSDQSVAGSVLNLPDLAGNTETIALLSDLTPGVVSEPNATSIVGGTGAGIGTGGFNTIYGVSAATGLSTGAGNTIIGHNANTGIAAGNTIAIGRNAQTGSSNSIALGFNSVSTGLRTVAIGANTNASIDGTMILGDGIAANSTYNVGVGTDAPEMNLQVGGTLGMDHLLRTTPTIDADIITSNLGIDKSGPEDEVYRINPGGGSVISMENGSIGFLGVTNAGLVGPSNPLDFDPVAGDFIEWLNLENDGSVRMRGQTIIASDGTNANTLEFEDNDGSESVTLTAPAAIGTPYTLILPTDQGAGVLTNNGGGILTWEPPANVTNINSDITFANGTNRQLRIEDGAGGNSLTVSPGTGLSVDGGALILNGGGSDNNAGGDVDINGGSSPGDGGSVTIDGANGNGGGGTGLGGAITLKAGDGAALSGDGGPISITAGSTLSSGGDTAGDVTITAGNGGGTSGGGDVTLNAGTSGSGTDGAILLNGNVGIGTPLPRREFHLNGAGGISFQMTNAASGSANQNTGFVIDYNDTDQTVDFRHYQDQNIAFGSSGTRNLYIDNVNGRVGIGIITPGSTLDVNGTISSSGNITVGSNITLNATGQINTNAAVTVNGAHLSAASYRIDGITTVIDNASNFTANNVSMTGDLTIAAGNTTLSNTGDIEHRGRMTSIPDPTVRSGVFTVMHRIVRLDADVPDLDPGQEGQEVILVATGALNVIHAGGGIIRLNGGVDFSMTPESTLHLVFVGGLWLEVGRSQP